MKVDGRVVEILCYDCKIIPDGLVRLRKIWSQGKPNNVDVVAFEDNILGSNKEHAAKQCTEAIHVIVRLRRDPNNAIYYLLKTQFLEAVEKYTQRKLFNTMH